MNKLIVFAIIVAVIAVGVGAYMLLIKTPEVQAPSLPPAELTENSHFGSIVEETAVELSIPWVRPHPGPFSWDLVEETQGTYDFSDTDDYVKAAQEQNLHILATIWPFAEWDQDYWKQQPGWQASQGFEGALPMSRYKPHDMEAYKRFVQAMVERYDNDGENDMPGLKYPIKYWEVLNEPELVGSELNFFTGTVSDYLEVLIATHDAIKSADPSAVIVQGGASGAGYGNSFWENLMALGGGNYFDIGNIHSINGPEDLNTGWYSALMENYGIRDFWVTEVEIGSGQVSQQQFRTEEDQAKLFVKGLVEAFGNGAERAFLATIISIPPGLSEESINAALVDATGRKKPAYYAIQTLMGKLDYFTSVQKLSSGQYKFTVNSKPVYVLWGTGSVPSEITGIVTVTDISGAVQQKQAPQITLSDSPIYVG